MHKWFQKKNVRNLVGIALVLALLAAGLLLPELYFSYYDKRTQNEPQFLDARVDTYQVEYKDFKQKIASLSQSGRLDNELIATRLQEADEETKSRLTDAVNRELDEFSVYQPVWADISCRIEDLKYCGLYTAYPKENGGEQFRGFTFWTISYEKEDEYKICLLLDAEFEKIVSCGVWNKRTQMCYEQLYAVNEKTGLMFDLYGELEYDVHYRWIESMAEYYDIASDIIDWGVVGTYFEVDGNRAESKEIKSELTDENSDYSIDTREWLWPCGYSLVNFNRDGYGELVLEYHVKAVQEIGYFVTGFECFHNFLQL